MPQDLSNLSNQELLALLYDPQTELEKAGNPAPPEAPEIPLELQKSPLSNPKVQAFFSRNPRMADMGPIAGLPEKQLKDAAVDASVGAAGNFAAGGLMNPALSTSYRWLNSLLSAAKGAGLNEAMTRGATALKGDPQPPVTDTGQILGDLISGGLGGLQGAGPSIPAPEDPRLMWLARKKAIDAELKRLNAQTPRIKSAVDAAKAAYENHQQGLSAATKSLGQNTAEDVTDQLLKEKANLRQLMANSPAPPDPGKVAELEGLIKKDLEISGKHKGIVQTQALQRLQRYRDALSKLHDDAEQQAADHAQQVINSKNNIDQMQVGARRLRTGQFDTIPSNADVAAGKKSIDLQNAWEQAQAGFAKHQADLERTKISGANHGEIEPPPTKDSEETWKKISKLIGKGGITASAATLFLKHLGMPTDVATELGLGLGAAAGTPQAANAARAFQNNISPGGLRVIPGLATVESEK